MNLPKNQNGTRIRNPKYSSLREYIRKEYITFLSVNPDYVAEILPEFKEPAKQKYDTFLVSLKEKAEGVAHSLGNENWEIDNLIKEYELALIRGCLTFCHSSQDNLNFFIRDEFAKFAYDNRYELLRFFSSDLCYQNRGFNPSLEKFKESLEAKTSQLAKKFRTDAQSVLEIIDDWHSMFHIGEFNNLYE